MRHPAGDRQQRNQDGEQTERNPDPVMPAGPVVIDAGDQIKVTAVAEVVDELGTGLQQQRIAWFELDTAYFVGHPHTIAMHGQYGRVVQLTKFGLFDRAAD